MTNKDTVSRVEYDRHIARSKDHGNYFSFFRPYVHIMKKLTALFLHDLINLSAGPNMKREEHEEGKIFFMCTVSFLIDSVISWTEDEQKYHLKLLVKKGFIELKRGGTHGLRWIRIDYKNIEDALDAAEFLSGGNSSQGEIPLRGKIPSDHRGNFPVNKKDSNESSEQEKKKQCRSQAHDGESEDIPSVEETANPSDRKKVMSSKEPFTKERIDSPQMKLAKRLHTILVEHNKVTRRVKNFNPWAYRFKELLDAKEGNYDHILKVLNWYGEKPHFKWKWTPKAYSATKFCDEFSAMEDAIVNWRREIEGIEDDTPSDNDRKDSGTMANGKPWKR